MCLLKFIFFTSCPKLLTGYILFSTMAMCTPYKHSREVQLFVLTSLLQWHPCVCMYLSVYEIYAAVCMSISWINAWKWHHWVRSHFTKSFTLTAVMVKARNPRTQRLKWNNHQEYMASLGLWKWYETLSLKEWNERETLDAYVGKDAQFRLCLVFYVTTPPLSAETTNVLFHSFFIWCVSSMSSFWMCSCVWFYLFTMSGFM